MVAFLAAAALATSALADGIARVVPRDGLQRVVWTVDGRADSSAPAPLVLALHGYRKPEEAHGLRLHPEQLGWPGLDGLARSEGFDALYPAAYRGQRSMTPGLRNAAFDDGTPLDDVGFLLRAVADLVEDGTADPERSTSPASRTARS